MRPRYNAANLPRGEALAVRSRRPDVGAQPQRLLQAQPLLMLLDGHAMVHRAWHAIQRPLTVRATGQEVRGVYGFTHMLRKAVEDFEPTHLAIAFDLPTPTFRHAKFEAYKAHRPEMAPELAQQFPHVRRLMETLQVPIYEMDGLEADDLLGALSQQAEAEDVDVLILTGDTDVLQLVSPRVRVVLQYRMAEQLVFDEIRVRERYGGLTPAQLIDLKALRGDPSDNIPGIPGVGEKTALRLLQQFGSVPAIYDNLDSVPEKQRTLLETHRDAAYLGLDLVTLRRDAPVRLDLDTSRWGRYRRADVVEFLRGLEFFSLVNWVPPGESDDGQEASRPAAPTADTVPLAYTTVTDDDALDTLVRELTASSGFAFDVETAPFDPKDRRIDPLRSDLVGLSFATAPGRAWYVPVGHVEGPQLPRERVLERLAPVLGDAALPKAAHKANYDATVLANLGVDVASVAFDTLLAAHLLGHKAIGLKNLALDLLGVEMTPIDELIGSGRKQITFAQVPVEGAADYSCADADMTYRLWQVLAKDLEREGLAQLFSDVEMPLAPVLVEMQVAGIKLDSLLLAQMGGELGTRLAELEEAAYASVGHRFNMNSPSQLGELLFGELRLHEKLEGMGRPKKTRTGAYSTDAAILDTLKDVHEVVNLVLENRQLAKLKSTYVDALPVLVNPRTAACTPATTRRAPSPVASPPTTPTCRTSPPARTWAAASAPPSSPASPAGSSSPPTTPRSSCASSPTSRRTRRSSTPSARTTTSTPPPPPRSTTSPWTPSQRTSGASPRCSTSASSTASAAGESPTRRGSAWRRAATSSPATSSGTRAPPTTATAPWPRPGSRATSRPCWAAGAPRRRSTPATPPSARPRSGRPSTCPSRAPRRRS